MTNFEIGSTVTEHCGFCRGRRDCTVRGHALKREHQDSVGWHQDTLLLQCGGCKNSFVHQNDYYGEYGEYGDYRIYDQAHRVIPLYEKRKRPAWLTDKEFQSLSNGALVATLNEIYTAIDNDLLLFSPLAIRCAVELIAIELGAKPEGNFGQKLKFLKSVAQLHESSAKQLEVAVEAGNAAAHRGWAVEPRDALALVGIIEHVIEDCFIRPKQIRTLELAAERIGKTVPKRHSPPTA